MSDFIYVVDELDCIERLDGDFDIHELMSDGSVRSRTVAASSLNTPSLCDTDF